MNLTVITEDLNLELENLITQGGLQFPYRRTSLNIGSQILVYGGLWIQIYLIISIALFVLLTTKLSGFYKIN